MVQSPVSGESEISWSETTTPNPDNIEEVVRPQATSRVTDSFRQRPRLYRPRIRRRLRVSEPPTGSGHSFHTFKFSAPDMRRSTEGSDVSSSSAFTVLTSAASSSCTDPWSASGFVEDGEVGGNANWDEDDLTVPKLEPLEDDVDMTDVKQVSVPPTPTSISTRAPTKRPRGRPRKHPIPTPESMAKITKGRSKTGCITCRKRKKKCDEAKPKCMNCEKNAVICEGYPEKTIWRSGKDKALEGEGTAISTSLEDASDLITSTARLRRVSLPTIKLRPVIHGVETAGDKMFFEHYIFRLSSKFTVEDERNNAFKDMLLPMAVQHLGLMHSILTLSSKHIDYKSPYGIKFLQEHPDVNVKMLEERSQFHHDEAMKELHSDIEKHLQGKDQNMIISARFGQMLCLVLQTLSDPHPRGEHRVHLKAYQSLIEQCPPQEGPFLEFITEFFQYHIGLDEIISLPQGRGRLGPVSDDWNLPTTIVQPDAVRLLGVSDGLFLYMSKITNIRNQLRQNMNSGLDPVVDYTSLYRAAEIDAGIREWTPAWPAGDSRDLAGLLYKQMMWVYLWRTIYPPKTTSWRPDERIKQAVNDGLDLLSRVPPQDPAQTLVLAPTFVIGCAAFEPEQREAIRKAIRIVKAYMEYKNSDTALQVLEEVWRLMDARDERSWDWQRIAHGMGMDFLAT